MGAQSNTQRQREQAKRRAARAKPKPLPHEEELQAALQHAALLKSRRGSLEEAKAQAEQELENVKAAELQIRGRIDTLRELRGEMPALPLPIALPPPEEPEGDGSG